MQLVLDLQGGQNSGQNIALINEQMQFIHSYTCNKDRYESSERGNDSLHLQRQIDKFKISTENSNHKSWIEVKLLITKWLEPF